MAGDNYNVKFKKKINASLLNKMILYPACRIK